MTTTTATTARRPTQRQRVLRMLLAHHEVCGSTFYEAYIPRFSAHIHTLRRAGWVISKRPCDRADHDHLGTSWLYRLEAVPVSGDPGDG